MYSNILKMYTSTEQGISLLFHTNAKQQRRFMPDKLAGRGLECEWWGCSLMCMQRCKCRSPVYVEFGGRSSYIYVHHSC